MNQNSTNRYTVQDTLVDADGSQAFAEYFVDINYHLLSDVALSYVPAHATKDKRPATIKVPQKVINQLAAFPLEMFGVPIEKIIRLAHKIKDNEGKSVLEPPEIKSKLILPD